MARGGKAAIEALAHGHPCHSCGALCCRYVAVALEAPKEPADRDLIRWYLVHKKVCVYIDRDGDWWVQVGTDCRNLAADGRCRDYDNRPQLCREYAMETCERADHDDENIAEFTTVDQFERFFKANFRVEGRRLRRRHRRYVAPA